MVLTSCLSNDLCLTFAVEIALYDVQIGTPSSPAKAVLINEPLQFQFDVSITYPFARAKCMYILWFGMKG